MLWRDDAGAATGVLATEPRGIDVCLRSSEICACLGGGNMQPFSLKSKAWPIMAQNGVNGTCTRMTRINVFFMLRLGDSVVKGAEQCQGRLVRARP